MLLKLWSDLGLTILFVTHDLDRPSSRRPSSDFAERVAGTIRADMSQCLCPIRGSRPKTRSEPEYLELRRASLPQHGRTSDGRSGGRTVKAWTAFRDLAHWA